MNGGHGVHPPGGRGEGEGFCVIIFQQLQRSTNVQGRMKEIIEEKIC